jgi:hypothetical protein
MGNDQELEFHEIKIGIFQKIETLIMRLKVFFIRRWKMLSNDQEIVMALGVLRGVG